jgi:tetratricopeptide (TPR) repeat protein
MPLPRILTHGASVTLLALTMGVATAQNAGNTRMIERAAEAANDTGGKQATSARLARLLTDALDDMKAQKYAAAIAKLESTQGIRGKSANEQHLIDDMLSFGYLKTNNYEAAARTLEREVRAGVSSPGEIAHEFGELCEINFHLKNYDKAIDFGTRAIEGGFADERITTIVGESYYLKGDYAGTRKVEEGLVEGRIRAGAVPDSESLTLIYSACRMTDDAACTEVALERLATYFPKPETWAQLLSTVYQQSSDNEANRLEVYRLMFDTDALPGPDSYQEMAALLLGGGYPGEAQAVLQQGMDRNVFTESRARQRGEHLLDAAKQVADAGRPALTKLAQQAEGATAGDSNAIAGRAFFGYGQFDSAADQLVKALLKGVTRGAAEDRLLLGIAQLKAGRRDDAFKSFGLVKGDPVLERLATLWQLHAKHT